MPLVLRIGRLAVAIALVAGMAVPAGASAASSLAHSSVQATGPGGRPLIKQGDQITVYETLTNSGSTAATNLTGTLSTTTTGVTVTSGTSRYPDIAAGTTGRNLQAFTAQLDPNVPCGRLISFNLALSGGATGNISFTVGTGLAGTAQPVPSTDTPLAISEGSPALSTIDVPTSALIKNLRVHVDSLDYASDQDIQLVLTGPDNAQVTLLSSGGVVGGSNFRDTVFSATGIASIGTGTAPFTGTYRASRLSRYEGTDQQGQWKLEARDAQTGNAASGALGGWSLEFDPPDCRPTASAGFSWSPDPIVPGDPATFDPSPSLDPKGELDHYEWDFGDGATSSAATPAHSYATRGRYDVTLTMKDLNNAAVASTTRTVVVDRVPVVTLDASPARASSIDQPVTLTATATPGPGGSIATYDFAVQDGTLDNTGSTSPTRTVTFSTSGTRSVSVIVTDDLGQSTVVTTNVVVDNLAPTAAFATTPATWAVVGRTTQFDGAASSDRDGSIATYQWDFGDGAGATQPLSSSSTSWTYGAPGDKQVTLRVVDDQGATTSITQTVRVTQAPSVALTANRANPVGKNVSVTFSTAGSSDDGSITRWDWDLDGIPGFEIADGAATQARSFSTYGSYVVRAQATDDHGVTTTRSITVVVANSAPVAAISASPNVATTGQSVTFDASASHDTEGPVAGYSWDLDGDGSYETFTGTTPTVSASFPNLGHIDVGVQVSDADGGTGTAVAGVDVIAPGTTPPATPPTGGGTGSTPTPSDPGATTTTGATTPPAGSGTTTPPGSGSTTSRGFSAGLTGSALQSLKLVLRKGIKLACDVDRAARCTVTLSISAADGRRLAVSKAKGSRPVTIGSGSLTASSAGSAQLVVRVLSSVATRLGKARKVVVRAAGTARSSDGATVKLSRGLILRG